MLISSHIINCGINAILSFCNLIFTLSPISTIWRILKFNQLRPISVYLGVLPTCSQGCIKLSQGYITLWYWQEMAPDSHSSSAFTGLPRDTPPIWAPVVRTGRLLLHTSQGLVGTLGSVKFMPLLHITENFLLFSWHFYTPFPMTQLLHMAKLNSTARLAVFPDSIPRYVLSAFTSPSSKSTRLFSRDTLAFIILPPLVNVFSS